MCEPMYMVVGRVGVESTWITLGDYGNLSNPAGICRVDLDGNVAESDEGNNNCPEDTVSIIAKKIYLLLVMR